MWNTDGGSMRGSGIYAEEHTIKGLVCEEEGCDFEGETDVYFDDWGNGSWTCEKCEAENTYEAPEMDCDPDWGDDG
jgi:hypothetical protein